MGYECERHFARFRAPEQTLDIANSAARELTPIACRPMMMELWEAGSNRQRLSVRHLLAHRLTGLAANLAGDQSG
jgi:hypothetical protein